MSSDSKSRAISIASFAAQGHGIRALMEVVASPKKQLLGPWDLWVRLEAGVWVGSVHV